VISRRQFLQGAGALGIGGVGFGSYALAEPFGCKVTTYRISPPRWPQGLSVRFAVLADLHACKPWMDAERIRGLVEWVNSLRADCVLLLGDYVAGHKLLRFADPVSHKDWAGALSHLTAPLGVHAVLGNHDWWDDESVQRVRRGPVAAALALRDAGIRVHENTCIRLAKDGNPFWLAGLGDQWAFWPRRGEQRAGSIPYIGVDDLAHTLSPAIDGAPIVLMAHEPDIFPRVPDRVSLTVCGHTHGGQVRVFGYAPIVPSRYGRRYLYGHVVEDDRHLVISGGLGCSALPVRFGVPPEVVLIDVAA
jgi:predicted MPP superfamily phosphohydrolase